MAIGDHFVDYMTVPLGDYGKIAVDSEVLTHSIKTHFDGKNVLAKEPIKPHDGCGNTNFWRFLLVLWQGNAILLVDNFLK